MTEVRSYDGTGNNLTNSTWGATGTELLRIAGAAYPGDGSGSTIITDPSRANPRTISNDVAAQTALVSNNKGLSDMIWQWGQFLDHDIDLSNAGASFGTADIYSSPSDLITYIPFSRSEYSSGTGVSGVPRQQMNSITAYIDASNVYGSDATRAAALRTNGGTGAYLATSTGNLLPFNNGTVTFDNANSGPLPADQLFLAGDVRANEQIGLTAMHTLFMREHNRLVDELSALPGTSWTDEELYQTARKIVGAEMQVITYNEFLPSLLGSSAIDPYAGYQSNVNASIANEFSTALFRLGHSLLNPNFQLVDNTGADVGQIALRDAFFSPGLLSDPGNADNLELILKGLTTQYAQDLDNMIVDDVRNFLFGPPGGMGMDLASLNIQRGRDHGLPDYNTVRAAYGLLVKTEFLTNGLLSDGLTANGITSDPVLAAKLQALYGTVDNIDVWVGALGEDHLANSMVGELIHAGLVDQFTRLRDGDRLFYLNDPDLFTGEIASVIDLNDWRLCDVILANTSMTNMRANVFSVPEPSTWLLLVLGTGLILGRKRFAARRRSEVG